jgi:glycosyltransferase involved in cell wall biosynthesis
MNTPAKNHDLFLRAASRLKEKFPETEFLLVGDGPLREQLEKLSRDLGLQRQVRFLGDRSDISAILASMDISVLASSTESLSNVMIESMAAGVPVVATAVGGNVELGADGRAVLVAPNDDQALAAGLERMLGEEQLRLDVSRLARDFAEEHFSLERIRQQYSELYAEAYNGTANVR